jgi:hypothetical protein
MADSMADPIFAHLGGSALLIDFDATGDTTLTDRAFADFLTTIDSADSPDGRLARGSAFSRPRAFGGGRTRGRLATKDGCRIGRRAGGTSLMLCLRPKAPTLRQPEGRTLGRIPACGLAKRVLVLASLGLAVAASPAIAADGAGTMTVSPTYVVSGSTGNVLTFTYTAPAGGLDNGKLTLLVPTGWTRPGGGFDPAATYASCTGDPVDVSNVAGGYLVSITGVTLSGGGTCTITYGSVFFGSYTGATAPSAGTSTFTAQEASTSSGTPTNLTAGSPQVVVGDDGTGTMTVSPTHVVAGSTGNTLTFTYTAAHPLTAGELTIAVPAGWSAPSTSSSAAGATTSTCGSGVSVSSSTIQITGVGLSPNGTCTVVYGNTAGGPGATAPSSGGYTHSSFTAKQAATNDNHLITLASSPEVSVTAADGAGTMSVTPTRVIANSTGNAFTFTYTAPAGGLDNGKLSLLVPTGWTRPGGGFDPAATYASCTGDPVGVSDVAGGYLVSITGIYLNGGGTCAITYGSTFFGTYTGVTAPSTESAYSFATKEASTATGTLTSIAASPLVNVGNDGTGTMTVSPAHVLAGSTGNTLTFTYTADNAIASGELTIAVPAGWSVPSTSSSAAGATTSNCGSGVGVSSSTIHVTGVTLSAADTCTVVYGNTAGGPGATASPSGGYTPVTFATQEKSSSTGTLTSLATGAPQLTVTAADGTGTMSVSPESAIQGSTGNAFTFTYTAPAGGLANGKLSLLVPTGWTRPGGGFDPAATYASCTGDPVGVTDVAGGYLVTVTGVSLNGGGTCTITYGSAFFGSFTGVTAPSTAGSYAFATKEASTATGTLTSIVDSPAVNVGDDGTGTMTVSPAHVVADSTGNTLTFT